MRSIASPIRGATEICWILLATRTAVRVASNIQQISVAPLIGEAMERISEARSVSSLFD